MPIAQAFTPKEMSVVRRWLENAFSEGILPEEGSEQLLDDLKPKVEPAPEEKRVPHGPTSVHVDRVLESLLKWEGKARKRMGRAAWRSPRRLHSPVGQAARAQSVSAPSTKE